MFLPFDTTFIDLAKVRMQTDGQLWATEVNGTKRTERLLPKRFKGVFHCFATTVREDYHARARDRHDGTIITTHFQTSPSDLPNINKSAKHQLERLDVL